MMVAEAYTRNVVHNHSLFFEYCCYDYYINFNFLPQFLSCFWKVAATLNSRKTTLKFFSLVYFEA